MSVQMEQDQVAPRRTSGTAQFDVVVERKETVAEGVVELTLRGRDGAGLPVWEPGSHIDLLIGNGLVRQYSICGDPSDRSEIRIAVLREPDSRGGSAYIHEHLAVGTVLTVGGPRNNFPLVASDRFLFIAGGIGITPLIPMLAAVEQRGLPWRLVYGGRTRASMAFADELRDRFPASVEILPEDEVGLLPLARVLEGADDHVAVYCCGPEALLSAVELECSRRSIPGLHIERFTPKPEVGSGAAGTFEIELAGSGRVFRVGEDESILDVLERAGIPVDSSCREGTCATCETSVIEGEIDHRDSVLTQAERDAGKVMFICVSRCRGRRLVLDL